MTLASRSLRYVRELRSLDRDIFGSKAAALGEMHAHGIRVPRGVAIGVHAARNAHELAELDMTAADFNDLATTIGVLLKVEEIHDELIVRSSGAVEDGARNSFAGQFTSVRCSDRATELADAMERVWNGRLATRVRQYATDRGTSAVGSDAAISFFAQEYITFDLSGVLFTTHPVLSIPGWMLVEFVPGDAADYVSGAVEPARCRLRDDGERVVWERLPGLIKPPAGTLKRLVDIAVEARTIFQTEVDIEWGVKDGVVTLLQCRPITTLQERAGPIGLMADRQDNAI
jgi:phosphoenolpyruvate synthase/pyruvate phosphate dikinase